MTKTMTKHADYSPYVPGLTVTDVTYSASLDAMLVDYDTPEFSHVVTVQGYYPQSQLLAMAHSHADSIARR